MTKGLSPYHWTQRNRGQKPSGARRSLFRCLGLEGPDYSPSWTRAQPKEHAVSWAVFSWSRNEGLGIGRKCRAFFLFLRGDRNNVVHLPRQDGLSKSYSHNVIDKRVGHVIKSAIFSPSSRMIRSSSLKYEESAINHIIIYFLHA